MKLAIVGSRNCGSHLRRKIEILDTVGMLQPEEIISGGAVGVDSIAETVAKAVGARMTVFPADWKTHGKRAGFVRNQQIVDACDELHAWWDGASRGTKHSIDLARKAGKPVTIHRIVL